MSNALQNGGKNEHSKLNFLLATDRRSKKGWMGGEPICSCAKINFSLLFKDVRVALV